MTRDEMILNNQNLIYYVLKKLNLYQFHEDLFDLGMINLIKGVDSFEKSKGKLVPYLYTCIYNGFLMNMRKKQLQTISIEKELGENLSLEDFLTDNKDFAKNIENNELIVQCLNVLTQKEKNIIIKYYGLFGMQKYTQKQIAKIYHHKQTYISKIIQKSIEKMRGVV